MALVDEKEATGRIIRTTTFSGRRVNSHVPEQAICLINIAHLEQRPKCPYPAFRILGFFENQVSLQAYAQQSWGNAEESLHMTNCHRLIPLCVNHESQYDISNVKKCVDRVVKLHDQLKEDSLKDLKKNVKQCRMGDTDNYSVNHRRKILSKKLTDINISKKNQGGDTGKDSVSCEYLTEANKLADQNYAAIVVLNDIRTCVLQGDAQPETCVAFLGAFRDLEEAKNYASKCEDYDGAVISVVHMYKWLFPELVDPSEIKTIYPKGEYQDIMNGLDGAREEDESKESLTHTLA